MKCRRMYFKAEFKEDILSGRKTSTIRLNSDVKVGEVVEVVAGGEHVGYAVITGVRVKKVSQLTDEDALVDGFPNREELLRALRRIYGRAIGGSTEVKVVTFKLLGR
ncbi:MAG: ASCH domain-containing protein [Desulfurococcaceae archaeon]|nr:ASCH domain-containing protein [Desulfurococcaceae archaeon]